MKNNHVVQCYTTAVGGSELVIQHVSDELVRQYQDQITVFTTNCYEQMRSIRPGCRS